MCGKVCVHYGNCQCCCEVALTGLGSGWGRKKSRESMECFALQKSSNLSVSLRRRGMCVVGGDGCAVTVEAM